MILLWENESRENMWLSIIWLTIGLEFCVHVVCACVFVNLLIISCVLSCGICSC